MMKVPLPYLLFISLSFAGMCSAANWEQKTREEDLLSGLVSSKVGVYLWMAALRTACGRFPRLDQQSLGVWLRYRVSLGSTQLRVKERPYRPQQACRLLYLWEFVQKEYASPRNVEKKSSHRLKSPFTQRRESQANTARKPYLLKRRGTD